MRYAIPLLLFAACAGIPPEEKVNALANIIEREVKLAEPDSGVEVAIYIGSAKTVINAIREWDGTEVSAMQIIAMIENLARDYENYLWVKYPADKAKRTRRMERLLSVIDGLKLLL